MEKFSGAKAEMEKVDSGITFSLQMGNVLCDDIATFRESRGLKLHRNESSDVNMNELCPDRGKHLHQPPVPLVY